MTAAPSTTFLENERPRPVFIGNDYPQLPVSSPGLAGPALTVLSSTQPDYAPASAYTSIDYPLVQVQVGAPTLTNTDAGITTAYTSIDYPDISSSNSSSIPALLLPYTLEVTILLYQI